jgi:type IV secretion system protein VirB8
MSKTSRQFTLIADKNTQTVHVSERSKLRQERDRAYLLIALLLCGIVALSIAVATLASIHTVVPVISVIDANGHVVEQEVVQKETIQGQESLIQSQVHDFITYCNTFDPAWRQRYSDLCRLHSSQQVADLYDREIAPENPNNPYFLIGGNGRRTPKITSISAVEKQAYRVSFQSVTDKPGSAPTIDYYTALVRFSFTNKPLALGDRWENALGFVATSYRKDQELSTQ